MNERIKELSMKVDPELAKETIYCTSNDLEKFAKLIVQECLSIMVNERQRQLGEFYTNVNGTAQDFIGLSGAIFTVDRIKQHFGVEE